MPTVTVNGCELYYEASGGGPAIAFIHGGYGGAASSVLPREESWVGAFTDAYTVVNYDRRSAGRSGYPAGEHTLDLLAADLRLLLQHLGIQRAIIIGSSAGGPIALTYVLTYAQSVIGLVLPNTSARLWRHETRERFADSVRHRAQFLKEHGAEATYSLIQAENARPNAPVLAPNGSGPRPSERREALEAREREVQRLVAALPRADRIRYAIGELRNQAAYVDSDLQPKLKEIRVPTLVVHGNQDLQVPLELGVELAEGIPGAKVVTVPGAGHGVMQWKPAVEAIRAFCDQVVVARASR